MSEVKRYEMKTTYRGHESWDSLEEDKDGGYVNYDDYAALEAKCAALAAENATLNDKMNRILVWPGIEFYSSAWEFCNLDGNDALELMCDNKTPVTDAFLAEVRAQGVEMFADHLLCPDLDDTIRDFAAQLRKGGERK